MMRYVVINPCNDYVYNGNGFLVLLGYGGIIAPTGALGAELYMRIIHQGVQTHVCIEQAVWADGSALTGNANLNSGVNFNRGVMVNGDSISTGHPNGGDACLAIECDTLEEAAQLL